jgi:hypothetical protein
MDIAHTSSPAMANQPSDTNNLLTVDFLDGSGRYAVADKETSKLTVRDKAASVLWTVDLAAKYQLKPRSIHSLKIIKETSFIEIVATPGASSFYFDCNTGKFEGVDFEHQTSESH